MFVKSERLRCQYSSSDVVVVMCLRYDDRKGPAAKVVMQNDGDFVEVILLYQGRYSQNVSWPNITYSILQFSPSTSAFPVVIILVISVLIHSSITDARLR